MTPQFGEKELKKENLDEGERKNQKSEREAEMEPQARGRIVLQCIERTEVSKL